MKSKRKKRKGKKEDTKEVEKKDKKKGITVEERTDDCNERVERKKEKKAKLNEMGRYY